MKAILKILIYAALFLLLLYLLMYLFFEKELDEVMEAFFPSASIQTAVSDKSVSVGYASLGSSFEPTVFTIDSRNLTLNIFESLVQTDRNLQIQPALALSWGRLNDNLWEFNLRKSVMFHDGSVLDADDVVASFNRARNEEISDLKDVLTTIKEVKKIDNFKVHIETHDPDPLLINRVSTVLIFPSELYDFTTPIGTGAYRYSGVNENIFEFKRFDDYWGSLPFFAVFNMVEISDRFQRLDAIKNGQIDILANVPTGFARDLEDLDSVTVVSLPSLEVNFLIFNFNSEVLKDKRIRTAISLAFDRDLFVDFSGGYAKPSYQFISNGVFGFNPNILQKNKDLAEAKKLVRDYDPFRRPSLTIDMVRGAEILGEYIKIQLDEIDIAVTMNFLPWDDLREKIVSKKSDMFFLGWKSELGDASDLYENIIFSKGALNGANYNNKKVDQLIELSLKNLDQKKRLLQMQEIMKIITEEDIVGVPLFESEIIYGIRVGVHFMPRLDGYIIASELH